MRSGLSEIRERKKFRQAAVARAIRVPRNTLWGWEHGKTLPGWAAVRLAGLYDVPANDVVAANEVDRSRRLNKAPKKEE